MKISKEKAIVAFYILYGDRHKGGNNPGTKLGSMKDGDKFNLIRVMKELKPVALSYDEFLRDAMDRLKTDGIEDIQGKMQLKEPLTPDEQEEWEKYNRLVSECVSEELGKEIDLPFRPLSDEGFKGLLASNDFTVAEIMALYEVIGE